MRFGLVSSLVLAVIAVVFALLNTQPMDVDLLFLETEGSTALVLILTFVFGVVVGLLSTVPSRIRIRRKLKKLQRERESDRQAEPSTPSSQSSISPQPGGSAEDSDQ